MKNLLVWSFVVGVVVMVALTTAGIRDWSGYALSGLASWAEQHRIAALLVFDALIWQWGAALFYLALRYRYFRRKGDRRARAARRTGYRLFAIIASTALFATVWTYLLKYSIMGPSSSSLLLGQEGIATSAFYGLVRKFGLGVFLDSTGPGSASGFMVYQVLLLLAYAKHRLGMQEDTDTRETPRALWLQTLVVVGFSLMVVVSRLVVGQHSLRDIGLAVGIGVSAFWLIYALRAVVQDGDREFLREVTLPLGSTILVGLFFCHSPRAWLLLAFSIMATLTVAYFLVAPCRRWLSGRHGT
jgi:hypothetical protein